MKSKTEQTHRNTNATAQESTDANSHIHTTSLSAGPAKIVGAASIAEMGSVAALAWNGELIKSNGAIKNTYPSGTHVLMKIFISK
jgi:hypothetical protein